MLRRTLLYAPIVAAAAGLPVVASKSGLFSSSPAVDETGLAEPSAPMTPSQRWPAAAPPQPQMQLPAQSYAHPAPAQAAARPALPLEHVFRLDVSPEWVNQHFERVSTTLADPQMPGMRVPLVTGDRIDDLTGSLTIYFDGSRQSQRMQFHGFTGDPKRLVQLVQSRYQMRPYASMSQALYLSQWNGIPTSALNVAFAPATIANHHPHRRYEIRLELNRPAAYFGLSPEFQALVDMERTRTQLGAMRGP
jgi:hypothetical protein